MILEVLAYASAILIVAITVIGTATLPYPEENE